MGKLPPPRLLPLLAALPLNRFTPYPQTASLEPTTSFGSASFLSLYTTELIETDRAFCMNNTSSPKYPYAYSILHPTPLDNPLPLFMHPFTLAVKVTPQFCPHGSLLLLTSRFWSGGSSEFVLLHLIIAQFSPLKFYPLQKFLSFIQQNWWNVKTGQLGYVTKLPRWLWALGTLRFSAKLVRIFFWPHFSDFNV